jgi:2'-phosphotransferase
MSKSSRRDVQISKTLSYLLRHGAEEHKLEIAPDGFVDLNELLDLPLVRNLQVTLEDVQRVVETNQKKRFELKQLPNLSWFIQAAQGHSIKSVQSDLLLSPINDPDAYPIVVHGTYKEAWESIKTLGLSKMSRNHVHFAIGYPKDMGVVSGMRGSCNVFIEIDMGQAIRDGMKFYISTNNVILTDGFDEGIVPVKYFKRVQTEQGESLGH